MFSARAVADGVSGSGPHWRYRHRDRARRRFHPLRQGLPGNAWPELDGFDLGGDAGVAGKHDDTGIFVELLQLRDQAQAGIAGHFQIDHSVFRWVLCRQYQGFGDIGSTTHGKAAFRQYHAQHGAKCRVVVNQQQAGLFCLHR